MKDILKAQTNTSFLEFVGRASNEFCKLIESAIKGHKEVLTSYFEEVHLEEEMKKLYEEEWVDSFLAEPQVAEKISRFKEEFLASIIELYCLHCEIVKNAEAKNSLIGQTVTWCKGFIQQSIKRQRIGQALGANQNKTETSGVARAVIALHMYFNAPAQQESEDELLTSARSFKSFWPDNESFVKLTTDFISLFCARFFEYLIDLPLLEIDYLAQDIIVIIQGFISKKNRPREKSVETLMLGLITKENNVIIDDLKKYLIGDSVISKFIDFAHSAPVRLTNNKICAPKNPGEKFKYQHLPVNYECLLEHTHNLSEDSYLSKNIKHLKESEPSTLEELFSIVTNQPNRHKIEIVNLYNETCDIYFSERGFKINLSKERRFLINFGSILNKGLKSKILDTYTNKNVAFPYFEEFAALEENLYKLNETFNDDVVNKPIIIQTELVPVLTKGEEDNALHAIFGKWHSTQGHFEADDIQSLRCQLADKIISSRAGDKLYEAACQEIKNLIENEIENNLNIGEAFTKLKNTYSEYYIEYKNKCDELWSNFEGILKENYLVIKILKDKCKKNSLMISQQWSDFANNYKSELNRILTENDDIAQSWKKYDVHSKSQFCYKDKITPAIIKEYANSRIRKKDVFLTLAEVEMISYAFNKTINVYTLQIKNGKSQLIYHASWNKDGADIVSLKFDGIHHFQRLLTPIEYNRIQSFYYNKRENLKLSNNSHAQQLVLTGQALTEECRKDVACGLCEEILTDPIVMPSTHLPDRFFHQKCFQQHAKKYVYLPNSDQNVKEGNLNLRDHVLDTNIAITVSLQELGDRSVKDPVKASNGIIYSRAALNNLFRGEETVLLGHRVKNEPIPLVGRPLRHVREKIDDILAKNRCKRFKSVANILHELITITGQSEGLFITAEEKNAFNELPLINMNGELCLSLAVPNELIKKFDLSNPSFREDWKRFLLSYANAPIEGLAVGAIAFIPSFFLSSPHVILISISAGLIWTLISLIGKYYANSFRKELFDLIYKSEKAKVEGSKELHKEIIDFLVDELGLCNTFGNPLVRAVRWLDLSNEEYSLAYMILAENAAEVRNNKTYFYYLKAYYYAEKAKNTYLKNVALMGRIKTLSSDYSIVKRDNIIMTPQEKENKLREVILLIGSKHSDIIQSYLNQILGLFYNAFHAIKSNQKAHEFFRFDNLSKFLLSQDIDIIKNLPGCDHYVVVLHFAQGFILQLAEVLRTPLDESLIRNIRHRFGFIGENYTTPHLARVKFEKSLECMNTMLENIESSTFNKVSHLFYILRLEIFDFIKFHIEKQTFKDDLLEHFNTKYSFLDKIDGPSGISEKNLLEVLKYHDLAKDRTLYSSVINILKHIKQDDVFAKKCFIGDRNWLHYLSCLEYQEKWAVLVREAFKVILSLNVSPDDKTIEGYTVIRLLELRDSYDLKKLLPVKRTKLQSVSIFSPSLKKEAPTYTKPQPIHLMASSQYKK